MPDWSKDYRRRIRTSYSNWLIHRLLLLLDLRPAETEAEAETVDLMEFLEIE